MRDSDDVRLSCGSGLAGLRFTPCTPVHTDLCAGSHSGLRVLPASQCTHVLCKAPDCVLQLQRSFLVIRPASSCSTCANWCYDIIRLVIEAKSMGNQSSCKEKRLKKVARLTGNFVFLSGCARWPLS